MLKKLLSRLKQDKALAVILAAGALVRFLHLDKVPPGIIHDELNYVLNAKSLFLTGKFIPLTASAILSWGEKNFDVVISELPSFLVAPWIGLNKLSLFSARSPYAFLGFLSIILIYKIAEKIVSPKAAIFCAFVFALNPWSIHIGRTALEVNFASFFFLLGLAALVRLDGRKIPWTLLCLTLMFFSYLGAKLQFITISSVFVIYKVIQKNDWKANKKYYLSFLVLAFGLFIFYYLTLPFQPAGQRKGELLLFDSSWSSEVVNRQRTISIQNSLQYFFSNKITVSAKRIADVYLNAFSPASLFSKGETISVYSVWEYGQFHFLDFFLIFIGIVSLYAINKKTFFLLLCLLAVSPIVSSIDLTEETYAIRAYPMFPVLCMFSGIGLWTLSKLRNGKIIAAVVIGAYILTFAYFYNLYIYRYPVFSSERWFFGERLISNYAKLASIKNPSQKIIVSTIENPKNVFEKYVFYHGFYDNKEDITNVNNKLENRDFSLGNVIFIHGCPAGDIGEAVLIYQSPLKCLQDDMKMARVLDLKDAGSVFVITDDILCSGFSKPRYYSNFKFSDFAVEEKSVREFCEKWVAKFYTQET